MQTENKAMGILGALIGTALGLVVWCLIGSLGYISAIGGLAICAGAFFGYYLLGKDMSAFGAIFCIVLIIASVYLGERITYAMALKEALEAYSDDVSLMDCFKNIEEVVEILDMKADYIGDMVKSYLFTAIGGACILAKAFRR